LIDTLVLALAIVYALWMMVATRYQLRTGRVVIIPLFAATLVFWLGIGAVIVFGLSPLNLLWWFVLSFLLGFGLLMLPFGVHLTMACLGLLAGLKPQQKTPSDRW
jgi:hypothetical protein